MIKVAHRPYLLLGVALLLLFVGWRETFLHMGRIVWQVDIYAHGWMVPFVTLWLIWRRVQAGSMPTPRFFPLASLGLLAICCLWMLGAAMQAGLVEHIALVSAIQMLVLMFLGPVFFRQILFPMAFLFLAVPFGGEYVVPMQTITAKLAISALGILGVEYQAEGVLITLKSGAYEVAAACAGIKFLFTSLVTGVLLCHLAFKSVWRRTLMMAAAFFVPIIANALRVLSTLLISEATDQSFARDVDHIVYGWGFLAFVLLILITGAYRFADRLDIDLPETAFEATSWRIDWTVMAMFLPVIIGTWMAPRAASSTCSFVPAEQPSCENCEFRALPLMRSGTLLSFATSDAQSEFLYRYAGLRITVHNAVFAPDREGHRLAGSGHRGLADDWLVVPGVGAASIEINGITFAEYVIRQGESRQLVWRSYYADGAFRKNRNAVKIALGMARLTGRPANGEVLTIAVDMVDGLEPTRALLTKFISTFPADRFLWKSHGDAEGKPECAV